MQHDFGFVLALAPTEQKPPLPAQSLPRAPSRRVVDRRAPSWRRRGNSTSRPGPEDAIQLPVEPLPEDPAQLVLAFPRPIVLSDIGRAIEAYIGQLASNGASFGGNQAIAATLGFCRSTVRHTLERLIRLRRIDIEEDGHRRRCLVRQVGRWTDWGIHGIPIPKPRREKKRASAARHPASAESVITAAMDDVRRVVTRIATSGDCMPNNPVLGELAGGKGRSSALRALRRLVRANVLRLEVRGSSRRVQVVETGRWTEWGEARPGHAPFLHRKRGEPAPALARVRKPETRPLPAVCPDHMPRAIDLGLVEDCQYAGWEDGRRPGRQPLFCGRPCEPRASFCTEHMDLCFPKRKRPVFVGISKAEMRGRLSTAEVLLDLAAGSLVAADRVYDTAALAG